MHWSYNNWCGYYPTTCHWWYNWCGSDYYFDPTCCVTYQWNYCPVQVISQGVVNKYSWHLGIDCVFIAGKGLGIQEVQAGSPADLAGLTAGMVIVQADGFDLAGEEVMPSVLQQSNGLLNLTILVEGDTEFYSADVEMLKVVTAGY